MESEINISSESDLVSIIMPMFNDEKYVRASIQSVLSQTHLNWELLVVDDHSSDASVSAVKSFSDPRIHLFQNEKNQGAAYSRNIALRNAKGHWIAFLDADDLWRSDKLEKQIAFMKKGGFDFSYSAYYEVNEDGVKNGTLITGPKHLTYRGMHHICYPGCLTMMYNRDKIGLIQVDPSIRKRNDDAIILQVVKKADAYYCPEALALYRRRNGSISHASRWKLLSYHYRVYRIIEKRTWLGAWFCALRNLFFYFWKKMRYVKHVKN